MSVLNNKGNPIVFFNQDNEPDYYSIFPNTYNVNSDKQYIEGMYAGGYKKDWVVNKEMRLQFQVVSPINEDLFVYKLNPLTLLWELYLLLDSTNITPNGWLSSSVIKYSFTPNEKGEYYIDFAAVNHKSQVFVVQDDLKWNKRIIEIDYYNSENDYGLIFFDDSVQVWTSGTYFQGTLKQIKPENNIDGFKPDRGGFKKTRSTPVESAQLTIIASHVSEIRQLNTIFSLDNITVNNVLYDNEEPPESTPIEKTDLISFVINLVEKNTDYFTK